MLKISLAVALVLASCLGGSSRTVHYAVGAKDYHAAPNKCSVVENTMGALVVLADHYKAKDGKGVVFEAAKPGKARVDCGDSNSAPIEVHDVARVELRRADGAKTPTPVGGYGPTICLVAFDKAGTELELGTLVDGVELVFSDHVSRVVDHGMGGAGNPACGSQQWTQKEGTATVSATWRGLTAKTEFEIKGKGP